MKFFKYLGFIILFFVLDFGVYMLTGSYKPTFVLTPTSFHIKELDNIEVLDIESVGMGEYYLLANNKKVYAVSVGENKISEIFSLDELHNPVRIAAYFHNLAVVDKMDNKTNIIIYNYDNLFKNVVLKEVLNTKQNNINDILSLSVYAKFKPHEHISGYEIEYVTNNYKLITYEKMSRKPFSSFYKENGLYKKAYLIKPKKWTTSGYGHILTDTENKIIYSDEYNIIKTSKKPSCSAIENEFEKTIMVAYEGEKGVSYSKIELSLFSKIIFKIHKISEFISLIPMIPFMGRQ